MSNISNAQLKALRIIPRVMAALSVLGSGSILYSVVFLGDSSSSASQRGRGNPKSQVLGRTLLCGMSVADLLSSTSYVVGNVAFPSNEVRGGKGNQATCNVQGFLCNLQVTAALYSGFLAWYYCLRIRYNWPDERLRRIFEPVAHAVSWLVALGTGIAALILKLYNPHWIRCYIAGPNTDIYFWTFFYMPILASMVSGTIAMLLIYLAVRQTEAKTLRYSFAYHSKRLSSNIGHQHNNLSSDFTPGEEEEEKKEEESCIANGNQQLPSSRNETAMSSATTQRPTLQRHLSRRESLAELPYTRRVAYQGLCYTVAFIIIYIFPITSRTWITVTKGKPPPTYPIRLLAVTMVTSQGFWNWVVYFGQPRVHRWWAQQRRHQHQSWGLFSRWTHSSLLRSNNTDKNDTHNNEEQAKQVQEMFLILEKHEQQQQRHLTSEAAVSKPQPVVVEEEAENSQQSNVTER